MNAKNIIAIIILLLIGFGLGVWITSRRAGDVAERISSLETSLEQARRALSDAQKSARRARAEITSIRASLAESRTIARELAGENQQLRNNLAKQREINRELTRIHTETGTAIDGIGGAIERGRESAKRLKKFVESDGN